MRWFYRVLALSSSLLVTRGAWAAMVEGTLVVDPQYDVMFRDENDPTNAIALGEVRLFYKYDAMMDSPLILFSAAWELGGTFRYKGETYLASDFSKEALDAIRIVDMEVEYHAAWPCYTTVGVALGVHKRSGGGFSESMGTNTGWEKFFDNCGEQRAREFVQQREEYKFGTVKRLWLTGFDKVGWEIDRKAKLKASRAALIDGESSLKVGRYAEAVEALSLAVEHDPENERAAELLAEARERLAEERQESGNDEDEATSQANKKKGKKKYKYDADWDVPSGPPPPPPTTTNFSGDAYFGFGFGAHAGFGSEMHLGAHLIGLLGPVALRGGYDTSQPFGSAGDGALEDEEYAESSAIDIDLLATVLSDQSMGPVVGIRFGSETRYLRGPDDTSPDEDAEISSDTAIGANLGWAIRTGAIVMSAGYTTQQSLFLFHFGLGFGTGKPKSY